ncbi:MAG: transcriptional repressor [Oligoflexales bacterium]|nr:transcriptional repressor [Oligoflexales bacterium]
MERKTKQRDTIFEVLRAENRPLSPQEILNYAQTKIPKLGIATVYRTIKEFLLAGEITEVKLFGSSPRYAIKSQEHQHHFWCRICDGLFNIGGCPGTLNFQPPQGFKTEFHEVIFRGLCSRCSA